MTDTPDWALLTRYLSGEAGPEERAIVEAWATADVEHQKLLESLEEVHHPDDDAFDSVDLDTEMSWLDEESQTAPGPVRRSRPVSIVPEWNRPSAQAAWWRSGYVLTAVVLILAAGVGALWWTNRRPTYHMAAVGHVYETVMGQRLSVTLADGTNVTLAPDSKLQVSKSYETGTGPRELQLDGQAYFAAVHDAAHPLMVHTASATVTDVGTEFDIQAYPSDDATRVVVVEGQVLVGAAFQQASSRPGASGMTLNAGDVATIGDAAVAVTHEPDITGLVAWRQGQLVFHNTPLSDVARTLERTFDLQVTIADTSLVTMPVTGTFSDASVAAVLDSVSHVIGAHYDRNGNKVVIHK